MNLMIESLELTNWRSHGKTNLKFRKGTNLIIGNMGAGKSSILDAISFSLFGSFPSLDRRKIKLEDIFRYNEDEIQLKTILEWEKNIYTIERKIKKGKTISTEAEIFKNGNLIEHGQTAVTEYIQQIIGINYDLFSRAIYSEQNNIDYFLNIDPRKRKQELDSLLGLDKIETARANITSVISQIKSRKDISSSNFDISKISNLEAEINNIQNEINQIIQRNTKNPLGILESLNKEKNINTQLKSLKENLERLEKELIKLVSEKDTLSKEIRKIDEKELVDKKNELDIINNEKKNELIEFGKFEQILANKRKEQGVVENKYKIKNETISKLQIALEQIQIIGNIADEIKNCEKNKLDLETEKRVCQKELLDSEKLLQHISPGINLCPLCYSEIKDPKHLVDEKQKMIKLAKNKIDEINEKLNFVKIKSDEFVSKNKIKTALEEQIKLHQKNLAENEDLEKNKLDLEKEIKELENQYKLKKEKNTELEKNSNKLQNEIKDIELQIKKNKDISIINGKIKDLEIKQKMIAFDQNEYEISNEKVNKLATEYQIAKIEQENFIKEEKIQKEKLALIQKQIEQFKLINKKIEYDIELEKQLVIYKNALLETQIQMRTSLIESINSAMAEIWGLFYPHRNYQGIRMNVTEKDYIVELNSNGQWKSIDSIASGGERASAVLSMRVALSIVLAPKLSWLMLDEPTHNLDNDAIELLSKTLQFKVPQVINQTFIITHEERLIGSEFSVAYRIYREKEKNEESKYEKI